MPSSNSSMSHSNSTSNASGTEPEHLNNELRLTRGEMLGLLGGPGTATSQTALAAGISGLLKAKRRLTMINRAKLQNKMNSDASRQRPRRRGENKSGKENHRSKVPLKSGSLDPCRAGALKRPQPSKVSPPAPVASFGKAALNLLLEHLSPGTPMHDLSASDSMHESGASQSSQVTDDPNDGRLELLESLPEGFTLEWDMQEDSLQTLDWSFPLDIERSVYGNMNPTRYDQDTLNSIVSILENDGSVPCEISSSRRVKGKLAYTN